MQLLLRTYHTTAFVHTQPVHMCRQIVNICHLVGRGWQLRHWYGQTGCPCCSHCGISTAPARLPTRKWSKYSSTASTLRKGSSKSTNDVLTCPTHWQQRCSSVHALQKLDASGYSLKQVAVPMSSSGRDQYLTERHSQCLLCCQQLPPRSFLAGPSCYVVPCNAPQPAR